MGTILQHFPLDSTRFAKIGGPRVSPPLAHCVHRRHFTGYITETFHWRHFPGDIPLGTFPRHCTGDNPPDTFHWIRSRDIPLETFSRRHFTRYIPETFHWRHSPGHISLDTFPTHFTGDIHRPRPRLYSEVLSFAENRGGRRWTLHGNDFDSRDAKFRQGNDIR